MNTIDQLRLADIMTRRVLCVAPACTLDLAASSMARARVSCIVVADGEQPVGILTDRDLVRLVHLRVDGATVISQLMSRPVVTANPGLDFRAAYALLRHHGVRHLLVVDDHSGTALGVVTLTDFLNHIGLDFFSKVRSLRAVTEPVLATLPPSASLAEALLLMVQLKSDLIVITQDRQPVGILTEGDMARLLTDHPDPDAVPLHRVMSSPVHFIDPNSSVAEAVSLLSTHSIRHLPVVNAERQILGLVNQARLLEKLGIELFDEAWRRSQELDRSKKRLESDLQMVMEVTSSATWEYDHVSDSHAWNPSVFGITSCTPETAPQSLADWIALIHPEDLPIFQQAMGSCTHCGDQMVEAEYRIRRTDGTWIWVHERVRVLQRSASGEPLRTVGILQDVSARKRTDQRLSLERQNFRRLFDTVDDYLFVVDHDGVILHVNRAVFELGYGEELIGKPMLSVHPSEFEAEARRMFNEVRAGTRRQCPIPIMKPSGERVYVDTRAVCGEWNGVPAIFGVSRNITEQIAQREALMQGEALLRTTLDSTADGILVVTAAGRILAMNHRFTELWRIPDELAQAGDDQSLLAFVEGQLLDPKGFRLDVARLYKTRDESTDILEFADNRIFQRYTRPIELPWEKARLWSFRDITAEAMTQRELETERGRLQTLIRTIPDPVWIKDLQGRYLACNAVFERMYGASESDILGKTDFDFVDEATARFFQHNDRAAAEAGVPLMNEEWLDFKQDGYRGLFETIKTPTLDAQGKLIGVLGIARDITAARQAQEALREREEIFSAIVNQAVDGIVLIDTETLRFVEFNDAACAGLGYKREEFAALNLTDIQADLKPAQVRDRMAQILAGTCLTVFEIRHVSKTGQARDMRVSNQVLKIHDHTYLAAIWQDITEQKQAARALQDAHMFLTETQTIARVGGWKANPVTDTVLWTEEVFHLLERPVDKPPATLEEGLDYYAPEILPELRGNLMVAWETGTPFNMECEMLAESGRRFYAELRCVGRVEEPGGSFLTGTFQDISERRRAETYLRESEQRFRTLFDNASVAIFVHDADTGRVLQVNQRALQILDCVPGEEIELSDVWNEPPYSREEALGMIRRCVAEGPQRFEWRKRTPDGTCLWLDITLDQIQLDGKCRVLAIALDTTERKKLEDEIRLRERYHRAVLDNFPFPVWLKDQESCFLSVNEPFARFFGQPSPESMVGKTDFDIAAPEFAERYRADDRAVLESGVPRNVEEPIESDGRTVWNETYKSPVLLNGQVIGTVGYARDISTRKSTEARVEFLAFHDPLTSLPNRTLAKDRAEQAMNLAERSGGKSALLFLDVDNFKTINDSLGHPVGDELLQVVATRLRECIRDTDTISRQGGDEFLILLTEVRDAESIEGVLEKILSRLATPIRVEGHELSTSLSIGVAVYPDDGRDFDTLFRRADTAMYRAKEAGRNTYRFFAPQMNVEATEHLRIRNHLHHALSKGELTLHFQPQVNLDSNLVTGAEALLRWHNPELGQVPPPRFIAIAEDCGLIGAIGEWVLQEACKQAAGWSKEFGVELTVAVNLSPVQFRRGDLAARIAAVLAETGLKPALLELEITESLLLQQTEFVLGTVREIKALGVKLAIDDFGTGYSSLAYLKRFNVDKLKIDQSFVRDMVSDPIDAAIVRATIQMARSLNLTTTAEGVETQQQLQFLREHQCDAAQGYYYAKPMAAGQFSAFLAGKCLPTGYGARVGSADS